MAFGLRALNGVGEARSSDRASLPMLGLEGPGVPCVPVLGAARGVGVAQKLLPSDSMDLGVPISLWDAYKNKRKGKKGKKRKNP